MTSQMIHGGRGDRVFFQQSGAVASRRNILIAVLIAILIVTGGLAAYFVYPRESAAPSSSSPPTSQNTTSQPPSNQSKESAPAVVPPTLYQVGVYFSKHPESDNDPSRTFPVSRTSPDLGVAAFVISELLKGPTSQEQGQGYFSTARLRSGASNCGGHDLTLSINQSIATLQFCRTFDHLGVVADGQAESEITATLMQFGSIKKVVVLSSTGNCEFNLSGMNACKQ